MATSATTQVLDASEMLYIDCGVPLNFWRSDPFSETTGPLNGYNEEASLSFDNVGFSVSASQRNSGSYKAVVSHT